MPLISLEGRPFDPKNDPPAVVSVLVHQTQARTVGVVVDEIVDIVQADISPEHRHASNVVVSGRVANLIRLVELIRSAGLEAA